MCIEDLHVRNMSASVAGTTEASGTNVRARLTLSATQSRRLRRLPKAERGPAVEGAPWRLAPAPKAPRRCSMSRLSPETLCVASGP